MGLGSHFIYFLFYNLIIVIYDNVVGELQPENWIGRVLWKIIYIFLISWKFF